MKAKELYVPENCVYEDVDECFLNHPEPAVTILVSHLDYAKLEARLESAEKTLREIKDIRSLPWIDLSDTDRERADTYSNVIHRIVYMARQALEKVVGDDE